MADAEPDVPDHAAGAEPEPELAAPVLVDEPSAYRPTCRSALTSSTASTSYDLDDHDGDDDDDRGRD